MNVSANSSIDYQGDGRRMQHFVMMKNIDKIALRPEDIVLDVGCGTGEETKMMAAKVRSITGFDISSNMIHIAQKNNLAPNIEYCTWDAHTCGDNPEWRERFDTVVSSFVLHWCADKAKVLRNILACLKPGGEGLLIACNRTPTMTAIEQFLLTHPKWGEYVKGYKSAFYPWDLSQDEIEELFTSCGWSDTKCELQDLTLALSKAQAKLTFKTILGQTAKIPEAEQEEYLEDMWQWALSQYEDESHLGHVLYPIENGVIHALKPL